MRTSHTPDRRVANRESSTEEAFERQQKTSFRDLDYENPLLDESFNDLDKGKDFNCFKNVLANLSDNLQKVQHQNKTHTNFTSFYEHPVRLKPFPRASSVNRKNRTDSSVVFDNTSSKILSSQNQLQDNKKSPLDHIRIASSTNQNLTKSITPDIHQLRHAETADATPEQINEIKPFDAIPEISSQPPKKLVMSAEPSPIQSRNGFRIRVIQNGQDFHDSVPTRPDSGAVKPQITYKELAITNILPPFTDVAPRATTSSKKIENQPQRRLDSRRRMTSKLDQFSQKLNKESQKSCETTPKKFLVVEDFQEIFGKSPGSVQQKKDMSDIRNSVSNSEVDGASGLRETRPRLIKADIKLNVFNKGYDAQTMTKSRPKEVLDRINQLMKEGKLASLKDKQAFVALRPIVRQVSTFDGCENSANMMMTEGRRRMNDYKTQLQNGSLGASNIVCHNFEVRKSPLKPRAIIEYPIAEQRPARAKTPHLIRRNY